MAEFCYFTGPMDCGKSTLALQLDYTHATSGRKGKLFASHDRAGEATISSRLGLSKPAVEVGLDFDFWYFVVEHLTGVRVLRTDERIQAGIDAVVEVGEQPHQPLAVLDDRLARAGRRGRHHRQRVLQPGHVAPERVVDDPDHPSVRRPVRSSLHGPHPR